jgi:hypothetical protein
VSSPCPVAGIPAICSPPVRCVAALATAESDKIYIAWNWLKVFNYDLVAGPAAQERLREQPPGSTRTHCLSVRHQGSAGRHQERDAKRRTHLSSPTVPADRMQEVPDRNGGLGLAGS